MLRPFIPGTESWVAFVALTWMLLSIIVVGLYVVARRHGPVFVPVFFDDAEEK